MDAEQESNFLIIDTESTDLFCKNPLSGQWLPADDPSSPYLAAFCGIFADRHLEIEEVHSIPIRPDGWTLSEEAARVNGLTMEYLESHGQNVDGVVDLYVNAIEQGRIVVAFNSWFDLKLMRGALRRAGRPDMLEQTKSICTMWALGRPRKLMTACMEQGIPYAGAHTALGDAMACLEIARKLQSKHKLPKPRMVRVSSALTGHEIEPF